MLGGRCIMRGQQRGLQWGTVAIITCVVVLIPSLAAGSRIERDEVDSIGIAALEVHEPFVINGSAALDAFCSWRGTDGLSPATAHLIDGLFIDARWNSSCIEIRGSDRYLVISNVTATRSGNAGIVIYNSKNVVVNNCIAVNNENGVLVSASINCTVVGSNLSRNYYSGILVLDSFNINVRINIATENHCHGIVLKGNVHNVFVANNIIMETRFHTRSQTVYAGTGVYSHAATGATIWGNAIAGCDMYGILLDSSSNMVVSDNVVYRSSQGCIRDHMGTANVLSGNECPPDFPWMVLVLAVPFLLALLLALASLLVIRVGKKRRDLAGSAAPRHSPLRVSLVAVGMLLGLVAMALFIPVNALVFFYRDVTSYLFLMSWGSVSNINPQNEPTVSLHVFSVPVILGIGMGCACVVYLMLKCSRWSRDKTIPARVFTVPLWAAVAGSGILISLNLFPTLLMWNVSRFPVFLFLLHSSCLLAWIAGLIFAWRARVGPWLVAPSSWEEAGTRKEYARETIHRVKELADMEENGTIVLDVVAMTWGCTIKQAKRAIKDLLFKRYIEGAFKDGGTTFTLQHLNLSFLDRAMPD